MIGSWPKGLDVISLLVSSLRLIVSVDVVKNKKPSTIFIEGKPSENGIRLLLLLRTLFDSVAVRLPCSADLCILCKYRETLHKRIPTVTIQP